MIILTKMQELLDEYGVKPKGVKGKGRAVRKWARTMRGSIDTILTQSQLMINGEALSPFDEYAGDGEGATYQDMIVEANRALLSEELVAAEVSDSTHDMILEHAILHDKVLIKIRPEVWHFIMKKSVAPFMVNGDTITDILAVAVEGKWNWHFFKKEPALVLVNRVELAELVTVIRTMLLGMGIKKRLNEDEWVTYARMLMAGCIGRIDEIGDMEADRIVKLA